MTKGDELAAAYQALVEAKQNIDETTERLSKPPTVDELVELNTALDAFRAADQKMASVWHESQWHSALGRDVRD